MTDEGSLRGGARTRCCLALQRRAPPGLAAAGAKDVVGRGSVGWRGHLHHAYLKNELIFCSSLLLLDIFFSLPDPGVVTAGVPGRD